VLGLIQEGLFEHVPDLGNDWFWPDCTLIIRNSSTSSRWGGEEWFWGCSGCADGTINSVSGPSTSHSSSKVLASVSGKCTWGLVELIVVVLLVVQIIQKNFICHGKPDSPAVNRVFLRYVATLLVPLTSSLMILSERQFLYDPTWNQSLKQGVFLETFPKIWVICRLAYLPKCIGLRRLACIITCVFIISTRFWVSLDNLLSELLQIILYKLMQRKPGYNWFFWLAVVRTLFYFISAIDVWFLIKVTVWCMYS